MISEQELKERVYVRKLFRNGRLEYLVMADNKEIFSSYSKQEAYHQAREERERMSIEETLYDIRVKVRPKEQERAQGAVYIQYPRFGDLPYCWKVYWGHELIGAYQSQWQAEQFRQEIIMNGGYD